MVYCESYFNNFFHQYFIVVKKTNFILVQKDFCFSFEKIKTNISSICDKYPDRVITSIPVKPYILQKTLLHWNWKKFFIKVAQQPQKTLDGSNQIWAMTSVKTNRSQWPGGWLYSSWNSRILEQDQRSWFLVM